MISLESAERPNYFLALSGDGHLQMEHWSQGAEFSRRATFIQHQGLFLPGLTSFELVGQPGTFLTLTRTLARAKRYDNTGGFKISSSFTLEGQAPRHRHKCSLKSPKKLVDVFLIWQRAVLSSHTVSCASGATRPVPTLVPTRAATQMRHAASFSRRKSLRSPLAPPNNSLLTQ